MANITFTLPGFPLLNQLVEASNPRDDCVFTSCAAIVTYLTGQKITGSQIKAMDNNYGPTYTGFASAANLVDTLDKLGVTLARCASSTQAGMVALLHQAIAAGMPCLVTMPSQWNSAALAKGWNPRTYTGYSHVGAACGLGRNSLGQGMIRVMNPWGGFWQDGADGWWQSRLLEGAIWVATRKATPPTVQASSASSQRVPAASSSSSSTTPPTALLTIAQYQAKIAQAIKDLS